MLEFDVRTAIVMTALAAMAAAAALMVARQLHLSVKGVDWWAWGMTCSAIGALTIGFRQDPPSPLSVLAGLPLMATGVTVIWVGMRLFTRRRVDWRLAIIPPALALAAVAWFLLVTPSIALRVGVTSAIMTILSGLVAAELWRGDGRPVGLARRFTGLVFTGHAVALFLRMAAMVTVDPVSPYVMPGRLYTVFAIEGLFYTVLASLGMALMTSEQLQEDLNRQASQDPLTGLLNRRAFAAAAEAVLARAQRSGGPVSLLLLDLDSFKRINDEHGHAAGDAVLVAFAVLAAGCLRQGDLLCRFGGEEFAVMLPDTPGDGALALAERIRAAFAAHAVEFHGKHLVNTTSIGVAEAGGGATLDDLLLCADAALYAAKHAGRDRVIAAQPAKPQIDEPSLAHQAPRR